MMFDVCNFGLCRKSVELGLGAGFPHNSASLLVMYRKACGGDADDADDADDEPCYHAKGHDVIAHHVSIVAPTLGTYLVLLRQV